MPSSTSARRTGKDNRRLGLGGQTAVCLCVLLFLLPACTAQPPTPSTASATAALLTPAPVCTPPACTNGNLVCESGACVGGCGVVCVPNAPSDAAPASYDELATWLVAAYENGRNPAAVRAALQEAGWQDDPNQWQSLDMDGDLQDDWAVVLLTPDAEPLGGFGMRPGDLWLVNQTGIAYRYSDYNPLDDPFIIAPTILHQTDITGDNLPELFLNSETCGAHTCYGNYRILGNLDGSVRDLVDTGLEDRHIISQSYADVRFDDYGEDGVADFWVHGGGVGSVGAGIVRPYTQIWSWDGTAVSLADTLLDYSDYRHHILYEANDELAAGNRDKATTLYEQVINDTTLQEPYSLVSEDALVYEDLSQFAAVRLVYIDLLKGDAVRANGRLSWLQQTYPSGFATQAAAQLVTGFVDENSLPALCEQIASSAAQVETPTGALADLGYGNPYLTGEDYCP